MAGVKGKSGRRASFLGSLLNRKTIYLGHEPGMKSDEERLLIAAENFGAKIGDHLTISQALVLLIRGATPDAKEQKQKKLKKGA